MAANESSTGKKIVGLAVALVLAIAMGAYCFGRQPGEREMKVAYFIDAGTDRCVRLSVDNDGRATMQETSRRSCGPGK